MVGLSQEQTCNVMSSKTTPEDTDVIDVEVPFAFVALFSANPLVGQYMI